MGESNKDESVLRKQLRREIKEQFYAEEREKFESENRDRIAKELKAELEFRRVSHDLYNRQHESKISMYMRMTMVTIFSLIGPILLFAALTGVFDSTLITTILDVFKIWLGAAVGISTNVLQKQPQETKIIKAE